MTAQHDLEEQITAWRTFLGTRSAVAPRDVDELETHLRDQIADLQQAGLSSDEAFIVSVKRLGSMDELSREFAREHSDRLWKQLVLGDTDAPQKRGASGLVLALVLGFTAALAVKLPDLLGVDDPTFYLRNASLLTLPFLAAYFAIRRRLGAAAIAVVVGVFAVVAVLLNVYPFAPDGGTEAFGTSPGATEILAAVHAVVVLWLAVGIAYVGGQWRSSRTRMDFVRFTGEWFVYFVLIALGGGVLSALTIAVFSALGMDASGFVGTWLVPCGAAGAVLVAAWLVEAKQAVIENIAPVLTKVFTPLFTGLLLALIVAAFVQRNLIDGQRDLLIIFDVVLLVVVALLLYAISARDPQAPPSWFERLQLVLVGSALVVDALVLIAMLARIGAYGFSANKVASLGLNVILLVNLAWSAWLLLGFVRRTSTFERLERWQTGYLPVYFVWAAIVVAVFPPLFGFV
ncbi:hypothetical protein ASD65_07120 [Microbacterium sp. Root61]|uniref:permease prefix domain 1-containing protein n=1 Tax=Microbacterium sp. Root61 TaxID=1736570 RepID=UPI0006F5173D|nr:permease prefix domain 1-containing protein [Microbacterium sp. Root61]KRA24216.1 hypothetical protein ASD65_07120 [Microbacterium sp. Root61]